MSALISSILWEHLLPMHFCCFVADISAVNFNSKHEAQKLCVAVAGLFFQSLSERSGADEIFLPIMLKMSVVLFCVDVKHKNMKALSAYDYHTKMFNVGASWPFSLSATLQLLSGNILMHLQYKPATLMYHHHFNTNTLSCGCHVVMFGHCITLSWLVSFMLSSQCDVVLTQKNYLASWGYNKCGSMGRFLDCFY